MSDHILQGCSSILMTCAFLMHGNIYILYDLVFNALNKYMYFGGVFFILRYSVKINVLLYSVCVHFCDKGSISYQFTEVMVTK